jgi:hypothetical protein
LLIALHCEFGPQGSGEQGSLFSSITGSLGGAKMYLNILNLTIKI